MALEPRVYTKGLYPFVFLSSFIIFFFFPSLSPHTSNYRSKEIVYLGFMPEEGDDAEFTIVNGVTSPSSPWLDLGLWLLADLV